MRTFKLFLSCPGDLSDEKAALTSVVNDVNAAWAIYLEIKFVIFEWKSGTFSSFGGETQEEIYRQLGKYDLYIGLMFAKYGYPTKNYDSGTEDEFQRALAARERTDGTIPALSFFFKRGSVSLIDPARVIQEAA